MDTATSHLPTSPMVPVHSQSEVLRPADGIELIGEFEGSGFKNPPLLVRRADGQVVQLTKLLYEVAAASDGDRDAQAVADVVSRRYGRTVSANDVVFLAERKLRPLGVLALPDGTTPTLKKRPPVMALRHRKPVLSERAVSAGASAFTWLHMPLVQVPVLLVLVAFDVWLFAVHGIAGGVRSALYDPVLLLAVFASVVVATAFHEFGHASACRYAGGRPGRMGVGLYLVWPVFYCDVTDAYRLNRAGRLRTDLGGIYFNAVFALLAGGVFFYTGQQAALLAAFLQHMLILQQLIPLMRFDGYYVVTDLTGVPDILSRFKPILRSLIRGRKHDPRVAELKPWVRWVVTIYLAGLVPAMLFLFGLMINGIPTLVATVWQAFAVQFAMIGRSGLAEMGVGAVRTTMLALELGGMGLSMFRVGQMASRPVLRWSRGSVPRTGATALAGAALLSVVAYVWWPHGDYRPIQPADRGTLQDGLNSLIKLAGRAGRVGLIAGNHVIGAVANATDALGPTTSAHGAIAGGGTSGSWGTNGGAASSAVGEGANGGSAASTPGTTTTAGGVSTAITTGTGTTPTTTTSVTGTGSTSTAPAPSTGGTGIGTSAPTTGGTSTGPTSTGSGTSTSPTTTGSGTSTTPTSTTTGSGTSATTTTTTTGPGTTTSPSTTSSTGTSTTAPPSTATGTTTAPTTATTTVPGTTTSTTTTP